MNDSTRRHLEALLRISRQPTTVAASIAVNGTLSTLSVTLWPSAWAYAGAGLCGALILVDALYLKKLLTSPGTR